MSRKIEANDIYLAINVLKHLKNCQTSIKNELKVAYFQQPHKIVMLRIMQPLLKSPLMVHSQ